MIRQAALALGVATVRAIDFDFTCQPPTRWVRLSYLVDTGADMSPYHGMMSGGALGDFDTWMRSKFDQGMSSGIVKFTQKINSSSAEDVCSEIAVPLQENNIVPFFDAMQKGDGGANDEVSVLDALYMGATQNWSNPVPAGRTIMVVFTSKDRSVPPNNAYTPWSAGCDCETCDYPEGSDIAAAFNANYQFVMFVVTPELVPSYEAFLGSSGLQGVVVPMVTDADQQGLIMVRGINEIYCGPEQESTQEDSGNTPDPFTLPPTLPPLPTEAPPTDGPTQPPLPTDGPTQPPTVEPTPTLYPPCSKEAVLQLVHLQDMSWSYNNDLQNMKDKFPDLFEMLDADFHGTEKGLGSFVDKPHAPSGYSYDWCYRRETDGFVDNQTFFDTLDSLEHSSGRDWKESQYDAIYEAIAKPGFEWIQDEYVGDHKVLRVVMLATDALPHVKGDQSELGDDLTKPCGERDYVSPEELAAALQEHNVVPLFVVTSDIYNPWVAKAKEIHEYSRVLHLDDSPKDLLDAIVSTLQLYCAMI